MLPSGAVQVRRAGFLTLVGAIAAATSCSSAGTPLPDPSVPDSGAPAAGDDAGPRVDAGTSGDGAVCQDDDGVPASCDGVTGSGYCSLGECDLARVELKSRVARTEIDCVRTQIELGGKCDGCRRVALESACDDATATDACDRIASTCAGKRPGFDRSACVTTAAGFTFGGRQKFIACMTESDCALPLDDCLRFFRLGP